MVKVSVVKCIDYSRENVDKAVRESLKLIDFNKNPKTILIKPNILGRFPIERGVTTHPSVIEAVCKYFSGAKIIIGESSGADTKISFETSGIKEVGKKYNCEIICFENTKLRKIKTESKYLKTIYLPEILFNVDLIVNVPKLKTHPLTIYTGALKNLYGTIPGAKKQQLHVIADNSEKFSDMISDLYNIVKPGLNIMDGVIGMEGNGPSTGTLIKTGLIFASENSVALDMAASEAIGLKAANVPTTKACLKKKYFDGIYERVGEDVRIKYKLPQSSFISLSGVLIKMRKQRVWIDKNKCKQCGTCKNHCPVKAIDENYNINYKKCISCLCCMELCPNIAVKQKGNWAVKTINICKKILGRKKRKFFGAAFFTEALPLRSGGAPTEPIKRCNGAPTESVDSIAFLRRFYSACKFRLPFLCSLCYIKLAFTEISHNRMI